MRIEEREAAWRDTHTEGAARGLALQHEVVRVRARARARVRVRVRVRVSLVAWLGLAWLALGLANPIPNPNLTPTLTPSLTLTLTRWRGSPWRRSD